LSSGAVAAVRAAVEALNDGEVEGYFRHFDPGCPRWIAGFTEPIGLADVRNGFEQLRDAFAGFHLHEDLLFGDDRFVCARWRMQGRHANEYLGVAPRGRSIDIETCEIYEVADATVVSSWVYGDVLAQLLTQLTADDGDAT
jgi:predicted ester cyclase